MDGELIKLFVPTTLAFVFGVLITPVLTHYLYKYRVWKKSGGKQALGGKEAVEFNRLHKKNETKTPRMGGIVIWGSVFLTVVALFIFKLIFPASTFVELDFLSRSQTLIPLFTLAVGAGLGFLNDFYEVTHAKKGITLRLRLLIIFVLSTFIGWWFYDKLDVQGISVPFDGVLHLGLWIIPVFILLTLAIYASGVIDGIDGLSGGVFVSVFTAYAGVAYLQEQFDIAALSGTIAGATLAFLWFNIPPARFWMTETGTMALTLTLAVIVFMTDALGDGYGISLFFIIGLPLVVTVLSNIIQVISKRVWKRKIFVIAPLHHHFEAIGWPSYKVTMRYWVISIMCAITGLLLASVT